MDVALQVPAVLARPKTLETFAMLPLLSSRMKRWNPGSEVHMRIGGSVRGAVETGVLERSLM